MSEARVVSWYWFRRGSNGDRWYYCEGDNTPRAAISWTARERAGLRTFATKEEAREHIRRFIKSWRHMGYRRRDFVIVKYTRPARRPPGIDAETLARWEQEAIASGKPVYFPLGEPEWGDEPEQKAPLRHGEGSDG